VSNARSEYQIFYYHDAPFARSSSFHVTFPYHEISVSEIKPKIIVRGEVNESYYLLLRIYEEYLLLSECARDS